MVMAEVLQEQLLTWEEVLTQREEALAAWEVKARIAEKALIKISADLDAERAKTEATCEEYVDKMHAHTDHAKHTLGLDKMLGREEGPAR
jgi:recombinational DNA repair ATPase RecF